MLRRDSLADMDTITYEDFLKVELRVGTITKSERVPKSNKLLKLEVYFGEHGTRTILAGIGKVYDPDAIVGTKIVAVMNLAPRQMMGIESHGMLLAAHGEGDHLGLATVMGVPDGAQLG